jgi:superfamily II DNA or RNA helicase
MDSIIIKQYNETYNKIVCDSGVAQELSEYFTFFVPGYKFMPAYKNKFWDGKIRLFNAASCLLYAGLNTYVENFCKERNYLVDYEGDFFNDEFSLKEAKEFITNTLEPTMEPRDYQMDAFVHSVRNRRALLLSPTASGKSFIIYMLVMYYLYKTEGKALIIVPTTSLVHQMASDFVAYGANGKMIHKIMGGVDKNVDLPITVSTWQSIYKMPKAYFDQFDIVIGDEAHLFKAKSLNSIMEKLDSCKYRFGFTGTLDGTQTHRLVLEGLFGAVRKVTTTSELIEQKHLAEFNIKAIILTYDDDVKKLISKATYQDEIDFIVRNNKRNNFIKNLALSLNGNTLLLFQFVEKHGKVLLDMIKKEAGERKIFFVSGSVDGEEREEIRKIVETESNAIIVASFGTFSTGINIKNLHNVIFSSPSKSRVRNLQSIGRGLRRSETKTESVLYDIADDLSWKSKKNYTLLHFIERMKIYSEEKFNYKIYKVALK